MNSRLAFILAALKSTGSVIPPDKMEKMGGVLVCGSKSFFDDDVKSTCACGKAIVHRPHAPKQLAKLCMDCGFSFMLATPNLKLGITEETNKELHE